MGEQVLELEKKLARYVGVKECVTCASGTDALLIPLMAKNIGKGDAVFTTNFSFFATTEVVSNLGATPVFVDVDSKTFNINPNLLEEEIQNVVKQGKLKPKAIIAVDLFGQLAQYDKIEKIAKKYNLLLLEDAAQSFGATYNKKKSCSFGDVAATSFFPAKPFGAYGDGGAIFTDDSDLANIFRSIRVHGQGIDKYDNIRIGLNSRLDTIQAVVLLNKLKILDNEIMLRNKIAEKYSLLLNDFLETPYVSNNNISSWAQYSLLCNNEIERKKLIQKLKINDVPTAIYYNKPFNELELYENICNKPFPVSKKHSQKIFSIPMHPYLTDSEIDKITSEIINFFN